MQTAFSSRVGDDIGESGAEVAEIHKPPIPFHYQEEVPQFVGPEIERLYANLYSSLPHLAIEGRLDDASTYVVRVEGKLTAVMLYEMDGNKVTVLNEVIDLGRAEIIQFSKYIFGVFKHVQVICFRAIHTDIRPVPFRIQCFNYLEDMTIALPDSEDTYTAMLSPKNRSNLRRKFKSIQADYPSFEIKCVEKEDIQEEQILTLVGFNRARMSAKKKASNYAKAESDRLVQLARKNGVMMLALIEGKICGGVVSYRIGENYFSLMVAHDPKYNEYSLGLLCNYRAICESIRHGAKELHFLWGRYHYKYTLMATPRELDFVVLYRSRLAYFFNIGVAARAHGLRLRRKFFLWKHHHKQEKGMFYRLSKFLPC